jgi:excisionase family DNA binding protein
MEMQRFGDHDILLTFREAADLLRVSRATMYRLISSGHLVGHKVGRGWRFYKADVHSVVARAGVEYQLSGDPAAVIVDEAAGGQPS